MHTGTALVQCRTLRHKLTAAAGRVLQALGWEKPGPQLGKALAVAVEWQLAHPQGSAQECEAHVRALFGSS